MSKSSATSRIICLSNGRSFNCELQCDQGDINQFYNDAGDVSPKFDTKNSPMLMFIATDSDNGAAPVAMGNDVEWIVNGVTLTFGGGTTSTNSFDGEVGHFVKATKNIQVGGSTYTVQCLKVVKNLLAINSKSSFAIIARYTYPIDNTSANLSATFPVTIGKGEVNSKRVRIQSASGYTGIPFTITKKEERDEGGKLIDGTYCKLEAVVISSDVVAGDQFAYDWYQQDSGEWKDLGLHTSTITVRESMVNGSALFKCVVKKDGTVYGSDIQNVNDRSDPWQVYVNCVDSNGTPSIEVSHKGDGIPILYKPYVKNAGSDTIVNGDTEVVINTQKVKRASFSMSLFDSVGTLLNYRPSENKPNNYEPPFYNDEAKTLFSIPEPFISAHAGIDLQVDVDIIDEI